MEGDQGGEAAGVVFAERPQHPPRRLLAVDVPDDQLGHHRVVHRRHLGAALDAGVDADAGAGGLAVGVADRARGGGEFLVRGLGVDPALDRPAVQLDVLLGDRERLAGGDQDLLADDVDAGDHLGHAVLDLDAGVHLEEEVLVADLHALDRAGAAVADRGGRVGGDLADPLAHLLVDVRARAPPRSPSGGGAGSSSRARRGGSRCRASRPAPGPRRGAGPRGSARRRRGRRRRTSRLRGRSPRRPPARSSGVIATRKPLPPPPPAALQATG